MATHWVTLPSYLRSLSRDIHFLPIVYNVSPRWGKGSAAVYLRGADMHHTLSLASVSSYHHDHDTYIPGQVDYEYSK